MNTDENRLYRHIGLAIRQRREALGITQVQLASKVKLLRTSIANLETGKQRMPLHSLYPICAALGIEVTAILPAINEVVKEPSLVLRIDADDQDVPARAAAVVTELLGNSPAQDKV